MGNKNSPLPATLVLGFAGSGKTSLIQHLTILDFGFVILDCPHK